MFKIPGLRAQFQWAPLKVPLPQLMQSTIRTNRKSGKVLNVLRNKIHLLLTNNHWNKVNSKSKTNECNIWLIISTKKPWKGIFQKRNIIVVSFKMTFLPRVKVLVLSCWPESGRNRLAPYTHDDHKDGSKWFLVKIDHLRSVYDKNVSGGRVKRLCVERKKLFVVLSTVLHGMMSFDSTWNHFYRTKKQTFFLNDWNFFSKFCFFFSKCWYETHN